MNQELTTARDEILIVDDDPGVLAALETLLSDTHEIHTAESGEVAWSILQQEDIDIALVDLSLPDFDGLELLTRLRQPHTALSAQTPQHCLDFSVHFDPLGHPLPELLPSLRSPSPYPSLPRAHIPMTGFPVDPGR